MNALLRLKNLFDTIPRFYCSERCQAPNAFYSGSPFLSAPPDGKLELKELESKEIEWQIWTSVDTVDDLKVFVNQQEIYNTDGHDLDGMIFTLKKQDVEFFGKFIKIKANVKIDSGPNSTKWTISVANDKDGERYLKDLISLYLPFLCHFKVVNKDVEVLLQKDAYLDEWSDWSPCTLSCIKEGSESFGTKTRSANCIEGMNGGQTCFDLLGDASQRKVEIVNCAGEVPYCAVNHSYLTWTSWSDCPKCFDQSEPANVKRKRTRACVDGRNGGSQCPKTVK